MGLVKRNAPFRRLRNVLLHQEEAHHQFGVRILERAIARDQISVEQLRNRMSDYFPIAESMLLSSTDLLESIDEDPQAYNSDFYQYLPDWLTGRGRTAKNLPRMPVKPLLSIANLTDDLGHHPGL